MSHDPELPGADSADDEFFGELFEEITRRIQSGGHVDLEQYIERFPERAGQIESMVPMLDMLNRLDASRTPDDTFGNSVRRGESGESPPSQILGDFRIVREIGRGGMGVVYEAEQLSLGRKVALKVLPFASVLDKRQISRFQNEAQAAARLHHQHIVPVFATGCERGVHFYAMQFIEGQTLAESIEDLRAQKTAEPTTRPSARQAEGVPGGGSESRTDPPGVRSVRTSRLSSVSASSRERVRRVAEIGIQAADALAYAHQVGVVHRDIKPANLLLDDQGDIWITDFGLAQFQSDGSLTLSGDILGTLRYMSPEQALGKRVDVDERTDVYSLGVTLYELLTLEPAITGRDREEILRKVSFEDPVTPRRLDASIPRDLETIVLKSIEKNPRERYSSANDLAEDLRLYLADKPIRARRPTTAQRAIKWSRRHGLLVGSLAVASAVALVLIAAGASLLAVHFGRVADENEKVAARNRQESERNAELAIQRQEESEQRRRSLSRLFVANGTQELDKGDVTGALVWFTSALDLDRDDPDRATAHRLRIATTLERCPRLRRVWRSEEGPVPSYSPNGRRYVVRDGDGWSLRDELDGREITRQPGRLTSKVFSEDGRRLLTVAGGEAKVWDATKGTLVASLDTDRPRLEATSFVLNARRVWTRTRAGTPQRFIVEVWDAETGRRVGPPVEAPITNCWPSVGPAGKRIVLALGKRIDVIDAVTGRSMLPPGVVFEHGSSVERVDFSRDGRLLATAGGADGTAQVRRTDTWERIALLEHDGTVESVRLSPDGSVVATGSHVGLVRVWDVGSGRLLRQRRVHEYKPFWVDFSPDGRHLLTDSGRSVLLWEYQTDKALELRGEVRTRHPRWGYSTFGSDGRFVLSRGREGLDLWDLAAIPSASPALTGSRANLFVEDDYLSGTRYHSVRSPDGRWRVQDRYLSQALNEPRLGSPSVWTATSTSDGRIVATAGSDGTARVWDGESYLPVTGPLHHSEPVVYVEISPDDRALLTVSGRSARVWNLATGVPLTPHLTQGGHLSHATFHPDGHHVVTAATDGLVTFWETNSGKRAGAPLVHDRPVALVRFSPDGRYLATSTRRDGDGSAHAGAVYIWDVATRELRHTLGETWATDLSFSRDGRRLVAALAAPSGHGVIWSSETGEVLARPGVHGCAECARFSPDETVVVTGGTDQRATISDAFTGEQLLTLPHRNPVFDARFTSGSPGSRWLVTATADGSAQVWDARTGEWVTPPFEHPGYLRAVTVSAGGRRLLTASHVARVRELVPDPRPLEQLQRLAHALSGRRVHPEANRLEEIEAGFPELLDRVREENPEEFILSRTREIRWHQRKAEDAYQDERWLDATAHLDVLIDAEPWRFPNVVLRGHARAELGMWPEAADDFDRAVTLGESDPWVYYCTALAHGAGGDESGYRSCSEKMLARFGTSGSPAAIRWLAWLCALRPEAVTGIDTVVERLEEALAASFDTPMTELCRGALRFRTGELDEAATILRRVIDSRAGAPSHRFAYLFLALVEEGRGRFAEANASFEASQRVSLGRTVWSIECALRLIQEEAASAVLPHRIGSIDERLRRFRGYVRDEEWALAQLALDALDSEVAAAERDPLTRALVRSARSRTNSRRFAGALSLLDLAERLGGPTAEIWLARFDALVASGKIEAGLDANRRAVEEASQLGDAGRALATQLRSWRLEYFLARRDMANAREAAGLGLDGVTPDADAPAIDRYFTELATEDVARAESPDLLDRLLGLAFIESLRTAARGKPVRESTLSLVQRVLDARADTYGHALVERSAVWGFLDDGSVPSKSWARPEFDDSSWRTGQAPLGFGDGRESTALRRTIQGESQPITYYFRHHFTNDIASPRRLLLKLARDDGAVVYLNGREVVRDNLPETIEIDGSTFALEAAGNDEETALHTFTVPTELLQHGSNLLAVEVHQATATSSDLHFEASLFATQLDARSFLGNLDESELERILRAASELLPSSIAIRWTHALRFAWSRTGAGSESLMGDLSAWRARRWIQEAVGHLEAAREAEEREAALSERVRDSKPEESDRRRADDRPSRSRKRARTAL